MANRIEAHSSHARLAHALLELDSFLIAAFCILHGDKTAIEFDEKEVRQTLDLLFEYGRGAVQTGEESLEVIDRYLATEQGPNA